jgi:phosphoribosylanthranilate isomerase
MCGITTLEDALIAASAGADALGFVFYEQSPRAVTPSQATEIIQKLPPFVTSVALFVDETPSFIEAVIKETQVDLLQFHGEESAAFCEQFNRPYIKAIRMREETDLAQLMKVYDSAQGLLVDTYKKGVPGGTGETFNWDWLKAQLEAMPDEAKKPIVLAGGLTPENVAPSIETVKPWAVDVSGGIEAFPGRKSAEKITQFMQEITRDKVDED